MTVPPEREAPLRERRTEERFGGGRFPLLNPASATLVDCGRRGVGIETGSPLAVGSLASVEIFAPAGETSLVGRVRWARMVASRRLARGEAAAVYRAGLSLVDDQCFEGWDLLFSRLISPRGRGKAAARSRRTVVRWRGRRP